MFNRVKVLTVGISLVIGYHCFGDAAADAIARAEKMPAAESLLALQKLEPSSPKNPDLLASIALDYCELVDSQGKRAADDALRYAKRAVDAGPNNAKAHVSLATAYGKMTDFVDNKTKMQLSQKIRDEANRAVQIDPRNDDALYILGRWYYEMANINPILRMAARMIYGALPPASNEEAQHYLERAVAIAPQKICNHQALAVVYKAMGKRDAARKQWQAVLSLPATDNDDRQAQVEARQGLSS